MVGIQLEGFSVVAIAHVCHEAGKAYHEELGNFDQFPWEAAHQWQRDSAIEGVKTQIANPNNDAVRSHNAWYTAKKRDGWVHGKKKDATLKTHPCMLPWVKLSKEDKGVDLLFVSICRALIPLLAEPAAVE